jgi:hypothetical protein
MTFEPISDLEIAARKLLHDDNREYRIFEGQARNSIRVAFKACWCGSYEPHEVARIIKGVQGLDISVDVIKQTLTKMVRAKTLRSRLIGGLRHYELNY